jgi:UDP-2,4-diacetamido-2,4,6-trideoxy-beta-L-altropyranose hydrolase
MTRPRVVLRVDADARIGTGHAVRSLTLGAALRARDIDVTVVSTGLPDALARQALEHGVAVEAGAADADRIAALHPDLVVVDGYHLAPLLADLVEVGQPFALVDDNHELPIAGASLILNQNLHANRALYPDADPAQRLLLGPPYLLLRTDVAALEPREPRQRADRVLVVIGGGDASGHTAGVVEELLRDEKLHVCIGVGAANPRREELMAFATRHADRVRVDPGDLVGGYTWADVAVIGAGATMWEVGYLGLPAIAVVVADNQSAAAAAAEQRGFVEAVDARSALDVAPLAERCAALVSDPARRRSMSSAGRAVFDGLGASRAAIEIDELIGART